MNEYDPVIGYGSLQNVDWGKLESNVSNIRKILEPYYQPSPEQTLLIAGCGDGSEAVALQKVMDMLVIGIDISLQEPVVKISGQLELRRQNLMEIEFPDDRFDLVYSYHVLEHVPDHMKVLQELRRVLKRSGVLFIGFPNKNRLVGYLNTHVDATLVDKIKWNMQDYGKKLTGKFENALGAHAGFTEKEFMRDALTVFEQVIPVRDQYFLQKYAGKKGLVNGLIKTGLNEYLYPSNYYVCK